MNDGKNRHGVTGFIDSVDDPVGASTGAVSIGERRSKSFSDPLGVVEQRPDDELIGGEGY